MKSMLIYIAGPYSADSEAERLANVQRAMLAGWQIIERGHWPVIPHLTHWFDQWAQEEALPIFYDTYLTWDLELVKRCDGIVYLAPSPGADRELALARELDLLIWTSVDEVPRV